MPHWQEKKQQTNRSTKMNEWFLWIYNVPAQKTFLHNILNGFALFGLLFMRKVTEYIQNEHDWWHATCLWFKSIIPDISWTRIRRVKMHLFVCLFVCLVDLRCCGKLSNKLEPVLMRCLLIAIDNICEEDCCRMCVSWMGFVNNEHYKINILSLFIYSLCI